MLPPAPSIAAPAPVDGAPLAKPAAPKAPPAASLLVSAESLEHDATAGARPRTTDATEAGLTAGVCRTPPRLVTQTARSETFHPCARLDPFLVTRVGLSQQSGECASIDASDRFFDAHRDEKNGARGHRIW